MALSRLVNLGATRTVQLRVEVFNLLNTFNLGNPETVLDLATFGRITTMSWKPADHAVRHQVWVLSLRTRDENAAGGPGRHARLEPGSRCIRLCTAVHDSGS